MSCLQHCLQKQEVRSRYLFSILHCSYTTHHLLRIIRLNSPNLNYFMISGAITIFVCDFFFVIPTINPAFTISTCIVSYKLSPSPACFTFTLYADSCMAGSNRPLIGFRNGYCKTVENLFDFQVLSTVTGYSIVI